MSLSAVAAESVVAPVEGTGAAPNLELLKIAAVAAMTADHVGAILFDRSFPWLTLIGRLAFPLFAFLVAYNATVHSRSGGRRYLGRLLVFAALSQPAYLWALCYPGEARANVLATLAVGLVAAVLATTPARAALAVLGLLLASLGETQAPGGHLMSFGFPGSLLVLAFALHLRWRAAGTAVLVAGSIALLSSDGGDLGHDLSRTLAAAASLPLIALSSRATWAPDWPRRAKWLFYAYYPAHLLLLLLIWNLWL